MISTVPECDWDALILDTEQKLTPEPGVARTCLHVCDESRLHKMTKWLKNRLIIFCVVLRFMIFLFVL